MPVIDNETEEKLRPFRTSLGNLLVSFIPVVPTFNLWQKQFPAGNLPGRYYSEEADRDKVFSLPLEVSKVLTTASALFILASSYERNISPILPMILPILLIHSFASFGVFLAKKDFNANARQQIMHVVDPHSSLWIQE